MFPLVNWDFTADFDSDANQASAVVRVFTAEDVSADDFDPDNATSVVTESITGAATSVEISNALNNGDYVAYIAATDEDGVETDACTTSFTVEGAGLSISFRPSAAAAGTLGCGSYVVRVQNRGGANPVEIAWETLSYGRKVDDMTDARVTIGVDGLADERCCLALSSLRAWEHEISIWRDGVEAWVGPVGDPEYTAEGVTIPARDLFQWMERRNLEHDRSFTDADLAVVFQQYVLDALERDTTPNITVEIYASSAAGTRSVLAAARRRAADELRELARTGVDFTMIGRRLLVGGAELPLPPLPLLHDAQVDNPKLVVRGLDAASEVIVVGATDANTTAPHVGVASRGVATVGLVQTTLNESSIKDDASCAEAANTRLDLLAAPAEFLTVDLLPATSVRFENLIPGTRWPVGVLVACREVVGTFRLAEVSVSATASDNGDTETVTVTLEPLGTTDDAAA